jgi:hypothetical protein
MWLRAMQQLLAQEVVCVLFELYNGRSTISIYIRFKEFIIERLVYQSSPIVTLATNRFINVPIVFQYESTPMIEVIKEAELGYTSSIPIYNQDGTYLAKVKGTRIFSTEAGSKAGLVIQKYSDRTVCKMEKKVLFEIFHQAGDAFKIYAELHTPDGFFVKFEDDPLPKLIDISGGMIKVGGTIFGGNTFENLRIGIWLKKDGSCAIAYS